MKRLALIVLLLAAPAFAQEKFALFNKGAPAPGGTTGCMVYSTSGSATLGCLTLGTTGFILTAGASAPAWADPNTFLSGYVKLQGSYPGSQQSGSFNVSGAAGSGPYTIAWPTATGPAATIDLLTAVSNSSVTVNDRYQMLLGDVNTSAHQLAISYHHATYGIGEFPSWAFYRASSVANSGMTLMSNGPVTNVCIQTDIAATGYPTVCAGGTAFNVGEDTGLTGLSINASGDITRIRGVLYSWPTSAAASATCLRRDFAGNLSWDTTCGTGATGYTGTVTSVALALPGDLYRQRFARNNNRNADWYACDTERKYDLRGTDDWRGGSADVPLARFGRHSEQCGGYHREVCDDGRIQHDDHGRKRGGGYGSGWFWIRSRHDGRDTRDVADNRGHRNCHECRYDRADHGRADHITGTIAISSFATTAPSPGAVPDATGAAADTYLDKSGTWTVPLGRQWLRWDRLDHG